MTLRRSSLLFRSQGLGVQVACAPWGTQVGTNVYQTMRGAGGLMLQTFAIATGPTGSLEVLARYVRVDRL